MRKERSGGPRSWIKRHEHRVGVRQALDLCQTAYGWSRALLDRDGRPAAAGGWPVRLVPQPAPRPITRHERHELRRTFRAQSTSFFDGDAVQRFERMLEQRFGPAHALACSSGTAALHTALMAAGVGPGDEVLVPVLTYVATALAVKQAGATPVFVDADPATWNIDPSALAARITPRTRAILPVHMAGVACDMEAIGELARAHGLFVIEDAAHSHGSTWRGRSLGTVGHLGCFSFGSPKTITTGEGGAIFTDDPELARRARIAMNLGECTPAGTPSMEIEDFRPEERLDYVRLGWNYRMSVGQASLGIAQLRRFDRIREARAGAGAYLREALAEVPGVGFQHVPADASPCYYTFPIEIGPEAGASRNELLAGLAREKIDYRLWSNVPLAAYSVFGGSPAQAARDFPVAERLCRNSIGLRVDPALRRRDLADTVLALRRLILWSRSRGSGDVDRTDRGSR